MRKATKILLNLHNSCRNPFQNYMRTSQKPVLFLWGERGFSRSISLCKGKPFGILIVSSDDFGNAENNSSNLWKISFTKFWLSFSHILDLESGSRTNIQKNEYWVTKAELMRQMMTRYVPVTRFVSLWQENTKVIYPVRVFTNAQNWQYCH